MLRRALRLATAAALVAALAPDAAAQSLFDRAKNAAKRTVQEAGEAARQTLVEEGMAEVGRLMLADGAFAGTAAPWLDAEAESVAQGALAGQAFVAPGRLALVFCAGPGLLDAVVFQGPLSADEPKTFDLADGDVSALLVAGGRTDRLRVSERSALTWGTLSVEPGDSGAGLVGEVTLAIGEDAVPRRVMSPLFERTRVVEVAGQFRATPVESIAGISCEPAADEPADE